MWALRKIWAYVAAALSILAMGLTLWFSARKIGKTEGQAEAADERAADREAIAVRRVNETTAAAEREVQAVQGANDVQTANAGVSDAAVVDELRNNWSRD